MAGGRDIWFGFGGWGAGGGEGSVEIWEGGGEPVSDTACEVDHFLFFGFFFFFFFSSSSFFFFFFFFLFRKAGWGRDGRVWVERSE